jgi:transcription antitermination factor NusG
VGDVRPGDRILIVSGPLKGIEAIFDRHLSASGRVRVLIEILDRLCRTEVHLDQIQRLPTIGIA